MYLNIYFFLVSVKPYQERCDQTVLMNPEAIYAMTVRECTNPKNCCTNITNCSVKFKVDKEINKWLYKICAKSLFYESKDCSSFNMYLNKPGDKTQVSDCYGHNMVKQIFFFQEPISEY